MASGETSSVLFDEAFIQLPGLTWLPWVGGNYASNPSNRRLLIVGESHYCNIEDYKEAAQHIGTLMEKRAYTRAVIEECPVNNLWRNRTLNRLNMLLAGQSQGSAQLWSDLAYYNFVQSPMRYSGVKQRPAWDDWVKGWHTFLSVVRILRPSHCVFVGFGAISACGPVMQQAGIPVHGVVKTEKIGRYWARRITVTIDGQQLDLTFIKHCGSYFSPGPWREFLTRSYPDLLPWLASRALSPA